MASKIRIKRSQVAGNPSILSAGELAYSAFDGAGGDRLYIGMGTEDSNGDAQNHFVIGGKYFTDMMDHTRGVLTADSAILVDSNKKIDNLKVDNLDFDGNTISSTNTDGNILLDPTGSGHVQIVGTNGLVIPVGTSNQRGPTTTGTIRFNTDTTQFEGYSGTNWASLGGVRSVDGLTFIVAELNPGDSDDTLYFYVATGSATNKIAMELDENSLTLNNTTDATSSSTGSFITAGGVGIAKKLYVGTDLHVLGNTFLGDAVTDSASITGKLTINLPDDDTVALDIKEGSNSYFKVVTTDDVEQVVFGSRPDVRITSSTTSTSTSTGALVVTGGVGIGGALFVNGAISAESATFASINNTPIGNVTPNTGAFTLLDVDNIRIDANTISSTNENGNITIQPNGSGGVVVPTSITGVTLLEVDNIRVDGNTISAINGEETNVNVVINPKGTGSVDVSDARITTVANPSEPQDAANKRYVDEVAQGLKARQAAWVLVDSNLSATYDADGYETGWATLTATDDGAFPTVDGISSTELNVVGARILLTGQTNAAHNGLYVVSTVGSESAPWVLRRCGSCRTSEQIPGSFVFIKLGTTYGNTGWVASVANVTTFVIGQDAITWIQFSGAGTFEAGDGLSLTGTVFSVNVPGEGAGGLEIVADNVQVKSTLAGDGLSYNQGVIAVGGTTDRISVSSTSIDISTNYVGQSSITTLGTIGTGTWQGTVISPTYGGTGVNNGSKTITLGGNFTTSGEHTLTLTTTGNTNVTLPTTGTLATLSGSETISNKVITNSSIGSTNPSTAAFTTLTASGLVTLTNATEASNLSTAAVVMSGGLAVAKKIFAGGDLVGAGPADSNLTGFNIDGGTY
jgi:hypothetical protein